MLYFHELVNKRYGLMAFRLLNGGNAHKHPLFEMFVVVNFMASPVLQTYLGLF